MHGGGEVSFLRCSEEEIVEENESNAVDASLDLYATPKPFSRFFAWKFVFLVSSFLFLGREKLLC